MRRIIVISALLVGVHCATCQDVILGVLEEVPGMYAGDPNSAQIRVLFRSDKGIWSTYPSNCPDTECLKTISAQYPSHSAWTVGYRGRSLVRVTSTAPADFAAYAWIGLQRLDSPSSAPSVGERSVEFGGFTGSEVHRPLVANSKPWLNDPDRWETASPPAAIVRLLRGEFRRLNPKLCTNSDKPGPNEYADESIAVTAALKSKSGFWIANLRLPDATDCEDGLGLGDSWFAVTPKDEVKFLADASVFVDAGDFNHDGKSKLLFSVDGYNLGGYVLYYYDFSKHVKFEFSYH